MRTHIVFLSLFTIFSFTQAQSVIPVSLEWKEPVTGEYDSHLFFEHASYQENGYPIYGKLFANEKIEEGFLTDIVTTPLPTEWMYLVKNKNVLPADFELNIINKYANSGNYGACEIFPIRCKNGIVEMLLSANLNIKLGEFDVTIPNTQRSISNSVLGSGSWVKMGTPYTGVYKITQNELQNTGLIGGSVSSDLIQIYGNGGGFLPEQNYLFRHDDLQQNAIEVIDGGDGSFDNGDYLLFYGEGPHEWKFDWSDSNKYRHLNNVYADTNFYFITIGTTPGLRLTNRTSLTGTPTYSTTTADGYTCREDDLKNLTRSGRQWMGDEFGFQNLYTYHFNLPDIDVSSNIDVTMKVASRCLSCAQSITLRYNGNLQMTLYPPAASDHYTNPFATSDIKETQFPVTGSNIDLVVEKPAPNIGEAWLDFIEINYRKNLRAGSGSNIFSDKNSLNQTNAKFSFDNAHPGNQVWDVTDPLAPIQQSFNLIGSTGEFQADVSDTLHSFVLFSANTAMTPASFKNIPNQNLHALTEQASDMLIITYSGFLNAAQDLANFHTTHDGMVVHVTTVDQIYNEYSSGKQDISAIRDYIKMNYDKHPVDYPKYVLLFGDGSFDYKPYLNRLDHDNTNFVPAFESMESFSRNGDSYSSDDFFALLDHNEGSYGSVVLSFSSNIDVGIGRIPARTLDEAQGIVNKIKQYVTDVEGMRDWRNIVTVVADDVDQPGDDDFFEECEKIAARIDQNAPVYNIDKIYMDSYQQISNAGQRYPEAEIALYNRINKGCLIVDYVGHGGETGMSAERVIQIDGFLSLTNTHHLPAFVTTTCTFTRFDNPEFNSAGEYLIQQPDKGAIALFSTVRPIWVMSYWDQKFYDACFQPMANGELPRLGDLMRLSKQPSNSGGEKNLLLFGDPAVRLAYPQIKVVTDSINGIAADTIPGFIADTLMASQLVTITGHIEDNNGTIQTTYDGDLYTTIFDKASQLTTLGNDIGPSFSYELRKNVIFKGKSTVENGKFKFQFIVPLDINYLIGNGKISYYSTDNIAKDAHGYYERFNIGGSENNCSSDSDGPEIEVFMNDTNFKEMGITQSATHLLVTVRDENGINTTGLGIGHDLQAIIDYDIQNPINLNDYYSANNNSYTEGTAEYYITDLSPGFHTVEVQVWDGCNNPNSAILNFAVTNGEPSVINFLAYPNPFSEEVILAFEHNFEGKQVTATVEIMDMQGHISKTWTKSYIPEGNREVSIKWDGTSAAGEHMGSGVYICRILMEDDQGNQASATCKLVMVN